MIKEWLASYNPANKIDATQALREIMQEVALAGLYRKGFFLCEMFQHFRPVCRENACAAFQEMERQCERARLV